MWMFSIQTLRAVFVVRRLEHETFFQFPLSRKDGLPD